MKNQKISKILYEISDLLEIQDIEFKPRAYEKAAQAISELEKNIAEIYKKGGIDALENISGVGESIAEKIEEYLKTDHIKYYEKLKKDMPVNIRDLTAIEGVGPKMVKALYKKLNIKSLNDLEKAAKKGKIKELEGFGRTTEENILKGIKFLEKNKGRFLLGLVLLQVEKIEQKINNLNEAKKAIIAGSIRRKKETVGDCDILAITSSGKASKKEMDFFVNMEEVVHVYGQGKTKSSVKLENGMDVDLRIVPEKSFGSALQYFTGNKAHNIALRKIAIKKGLKLSEYGIFEGKKQIAGRTEKEVYKALGLKWIEPELRTNKGEIEASRKTRGKPGGLPNLIEYNELKCDLQMHTTDSDGVNSIQEMANAAMKLGREYIAITDHSKGLSVVTGLDEEGFKQQGKEIDKINNKIKKSDKKFKILKGAEINIKKDGKLDLKDEALKKLDVVGIAVHSNFKMSKKKMTERIIRAMKNPYVNILFHPTGRMIQKRPGYELDMEKIIKAAKQYNVILEVNANPERLDLKDEYIKMVVDNNWKIAIDTDAHSISSLDFLKFGIAQARRGWAEKKHVINALPLKKLLSLLNK